MIRYGIASYHRPHCKTLKTLLDMGAEPERLLVHLNDRNDLALYKARWDGKAELRYERKYNAAGNRNNILDYLADTEDDFIILDDDIRSFVAFDMNAGKWGRWNKIDDIRELDRYMEECFAKARSVGADIFGCTSASNSMVTKGTIKSDGIWSVNKNFAGVISGITNKSIRYDETYDTLEDYELNLRVLRRGGRLLRRNGITAFSDPMMKTEGGMREHYEAGLKPICLQRIADEYGDMVRIKKDGTGLVLTWKG